MQRAPNSMSDLSSICKTDIRTLERAYRDCETRMGRPATDVEVCEELGITLPGLYRQLNRYRWLKLGRFVKIQRLESGRSEVSVKYIPFIWDEEISYLYAESEFRRSLNQAINALPKNEQLVLLLRYQQKKTLAEIAALIGFSKVRVAQIHTSAMLRIRPKLLELRDKELCFHLSSGETVPAA